MAAQPKPFSAFETMIAWRYLRAKRAEGGVSVMTWISLIGITLAVFALIATLAVRAGFRAEFVDTIVGANAHVTVYNAGTVDQQTGRIDRKITDYGAMAERLRDVEGVTGAAPTIRAQVLANVRDRNVGIDVRGISLEDLKNLPRIVNPETGIGDIEEFAQNPEETGVYPIAIGSGVARELGGVGVGDRIRVINPTGTTNPLTGTSPRINAYDVVYIFSAGRYDIDRVRVYLPFEEAQEFFNSEGKADEIEVMIEQPERVNEMSLDLLRAAGDNTQIWTWQDASSGFLRALEVEDNVMFIILSILVLIAAMNITSGLIMLVKNKGRDIGILRTMGLTEGSVLRVFFMCGAFIGIIGTVMGTILGCLFAIYIDQIFAILDSFSDQPIWTPDTRGIYFLPAKLEFWDVMSAVGLSLFLSFVVTIFPARRAARMNPVEALRYE